VQFVKSVLRSVPSSSESSGKTSDEAVFGEHLVDLIWSLDLELDELVSDAKLAITNCGDQASDPNSNASAIFSKAMKAKQNAENDKQVITVVVKNLLVRRLSLNTASL
jgi:THO complex subunit 2